MLDDIAALRPYKETADLVAECDDWKPLYDLEVLERNSVPVAAAVYYDDMYVDFNLSQDTLSHVRGARQWISNEFLHSGNSAAPLHTPSCLSGRSQVRPLARNEDGKAMLPLCLI